MVYGNITQLVEFMLCKHEVESSSLSVSRIKSDKGNILIFTNDIKNKKGKKRSSAFYD